MPGCLRCSLTVIIGFLAFGPGRVVAWEPPAGTSPQAAAERWKNDRLWGQPEPGPAYEAQRVYEGVPLVEPVGMARAPGEDRLFVYERRGRLYSFPDTAKIRGGDPVEPDLCLDLQEISPDAREIYGVAFAPDFAQSRDVYICYIAKADDDEGTRVSRFKIPTGDVPRVNLASEQLLLTFRSGGHNGGCLRFGPDGYLYISTGDAGPASPPDPLLTGQDDRDLLSSILRIDVSQSSADLPYRIPDDNPFVNQPNSRAEIWAYGLRNPWKMSFDMESGDLWVGDVGWELWEMIYRIVPGGNYGWRVREGHQLIHPNDQLGPTPILSPTVVHSHRESRSITGGYVYRGKKLPELQGHYVYADYETGKVWSFRFEKELVREASELADTELKIVAFGQTLEDELLLVDFRGGLYELVPRTETSFNPEFPQLLSETGLFSQLETQTPAPGVHPYQLIAEPWMDGAIAQRWIANPTDELPTLAGQGFRFPDGTVLVKTIALEPPLNPTSSESASGGQDPLRRIETQILLLNGGVWQGYSYVWNQDQTDAMLVGSDGLEVALTSQDHPAEAQAAQDAATWSIPSRAECLVCHTTFLPEMGILGYEPLQLDRLLEAGAESGRQTEFLNQAGVLPAGSLSDQTLVDPYDRTASLEHRARSYLHVNCRHCHRDGGGGGSTMKLEFNRPLAELDLVDWKAQHGDFGLSAGQRVRAGVPEDSVMLLRMAKIGRGRMPYKGSTRVDPTGVALLSDWIESLPETPRTGPAANRRPSSELDSLAANWDPELAQRWLGSESEALRLVVDLHRRSSAESHRQQWASLAGQQSNPLVRDLLDGLGPGTGSRRLLGRDFDEDPLLASTGDPAIGRELFFSPQFQCATCHRVSGQGGELGPDLSSIASQQSQRQLLQSLKTPSEKLTEGFETTLIETLDGNIVSGRVLSRTNEALQVATADSKILVIALNDVSVLEKSPKSLMPDDLVSNMTAEELVDLLAFLKTLRAP